MLALHHEVSKGGQMRAYTIVQIRGRAYDHQVTVTIESKWTRIYLLFGERGATVNMVLCRGWTSRDYLALVHELFIYAEIYSIKYIVSSFVGGWPHRALEDMETKLVVTGTRSPVKVVNVLPRGAICLTDDTLQNTLVVMR